MAWVHDLNPFAIQLTEHFGIRWYGLAYLSGFVIGYYIAVWMSKRGGIELSIPELADFTTYSAIGVLAGGRLGYALFYAPELFTSIDNHFPYWGVLKVNEGGMASHGGILGVLLMSYLFARKYKKSFWHCQDLTTYAGGLGFFFGRLANFINGELYGREAPASFHWGVKFPQEMFLWADKDFHRLSTLGPVVDKLGEPGVTASVWQSWLNSYGDFHVRNQIYETLERIVTAVQAHNAEVIAALQPLLTTRYPSQLIQAVLEGLLVFLALFWIWRVPRKPGVVSCWFGILYAIARIAGEQFRLPDAQIGYQLLGLTRGQWISIALLVASSVVLVVVSRLPTKPMGGWATKKTRQN